MLHWPTGYRSRNVCRVDDKINTLHHSLRLSLPNYVSMRLVLERVFILR